jgi:His-Xaa-Ser system protein HxsD
MKDINYTMQDGRAVVSLKTTIYDKEAIFTASNKFIDKCVVFIEPLDEFTINVYFKHKNNFGHEALEKVVSDFYNDLIEQQLRVILEKKFGNIRELIVKQAFSPIQNLETEIKL